MAFIHKVQFCWLMVLVFIILLMLKLDGRIGDWNWFIVFIPMWILDCVVAAFTLINMIMHCKNKWWHNVHETSLKRKTWSLCGVISKLVFQVLLCLKLQYFHTLRIFVIFVPFWVFITGCIVEVSISLYRVHVNS